MKVTIIIAITLMVVAISLASEENFTVGNRNFTVKLFQEIIKKKTDQNIVFAPISVQILLALLTSATSTGGPAIEEIISVLELPLQKSEIHEQFRNITQELNKRNDDFKMFNANKIYFGSGCTIRKWFKDDAVNIYNTSMGLIDFQGSEHAAKTINKWVAQRTNHKIENFIQPSDIPYNTRTLMINALYLRGKWDTPFKAENTIPDTFYTSNGSKQVAMMKTLERSYLYFEDDEAKYLKIELLREDGGAEVVFVLPRKRHGLRALIQNNLTAALFPHNFSLARVTVALPKFKIANDVPLKQILQNLGVKSIFSSVRLEGYKFYGHEYNTVSDVFQKALIEVDEYGVTAIAGTGDLKQQRVMVRSDKCSKNIARHVQSSPNKASWLQECLENQLVLIWNNHLFS